MYGVSFEELGCGFRKGSGFVLIGEGRGKSEDGFPIKTVGDDENGKIDAEERDD